MNETMGNILARLRKEKGMTQEQLANELGISYQAVSKWENELSSPDISALPLLADIFGVSVDALFGRESAKAENLPVPVKEERAEEERTELPWPDDETLHVVFFAGRKLIGKEDVDRHLSVQKKIQFQYEGPALNIESAFDVTVDGDVQGGVTAGGDVQCGMVGDSVSAEGDVTCDTVGGGVNAGGDVTCDTVNGSVSAGGDVTCDDVYGNVSAGGDVSCDDVTGNVFAGGDVSCDDVSGSADAGGDKSGKGFSFRIKI